VNYDESKIVTDPDLLAKLNGTTDSPGSNSPEARNSDKFVTDPELLAKLNATSDPMTEIESKSGRGIGDRIGGMLETSASVASSVLAEPVAGLAGLAAGAVSGSPETAARVVEDVRRDTTYSPRSEAGQEYLQNVGEVLAPVGEAITGLSETLGDTAMEWTGSPELAAAAYSIPTAVLEMMGVKGARVGRKFAEKDLRTAQKTMLSDPTLKTHEAVADVKISAGGQVVEAPEGVKLLDSGLNRSDTSLIVHSSPETKRNMKKMTEAYSQAIANKKAAALKSPSDMMGASLQRRLGFAAKRREMLGKDLDELVKGGVGRQQIDVADVIGPFNEMIGELTPPGAKKIKPKMTPKGRVYLPKNWYKGTALDAQGMGPARRLVQDAYKLYGNLTEFGVTDVKSAHALKKSLDELIDQAKLGESSTRGQSMRKAISMRAAINDKLSTVEGYGKINGELSQLIDAMRPFDDAKGTAKSWGEAGVRSRLGKMAESLADPQAGAELQRGLAALDGYIAKSGKGMGDDVIGMATFKRLLDDNLNTVPGRVDSSGQMSEAAAGLATSAAVNNVFGAAHDVGRMVKLGMRKGEAEKVAAQNQKALRAIKEALETP
jgi:hypothetical protein